MTENKIDEITEDTIENGSSKVKTIQWIDIQKIIMYEFKAVRFRRLRIFHSYLMILLIEIFFSVFLVYINPYDWEITSNKIILLLFLIVPIFITNIYKIIIYITEDIIMMENLIQFNESWTLDKLHNCIIGIRFFDMILSTGDIKVLYILYPVIFISIFHI